MKGLIILLVAITTVACNPEVYKQKHEITDQRFNGVFNEYVCLTDCGTASEEYVNSQFVFEGMNFVNYEQVNTTTNHSFINQEFETNSTMTMYRYRDWENNENEGWSSWKSYSFTGTILTLTNFFGTTYIAEKIQ